MLSNWLLDASLTWAQRNRIQSSRRRVCMQSRAEDRFVPLIVPQFAPRLGYPAYRGPHEFWVRWIANRGGFLLRPPQAPRVRRQIIRQRALSLWPPPLRGFWAVP